MPIDSRGYFMLPQAPEEAAYYPYGTPDAGRAQYGHPKLLTFIFLVEHRWAMQDERKIGIGNISRADGRRSDHRSHLNGLQVDIRPLRKDGKNIPVQYFHAQYDQAATARLIDLFWQTGLVKNIFFNDTSIARVRKLAGHDNHIHVDILN